MLHWCILGNDYQPYLSLSSFLTSHYHAVSLLQSNILKTRCYLHIYIYILHVECITAYFHSQLAVNLSHPLLREMFWLSGTSVCLFPTSGCAPGTRCDSRVRYLCPNPAVSRYVCCCIPQCIRFCGFTAMLNEVTVPWSAQTQLWRELARGSRCRSVTWCRV